MLLSCKNEQQAQSASPKSIPEDNPPLQTQQENMDAVPLGHCRVKGKVMEEGEQKKLEVIEYLGMGRNFNYSIPKTGDIIRISAAETLKSGEIIIVDLLPKAEQKGNEIPQMRVSKIIETPN